GAGGAYRLQLSAAVAALEVPVHRDGSGNVRAVELDGAGGKLVGLQARAVAAYGLGVELIGAAADLHAQGVPGAVVVEAVGLRRDGEGEGGTAGAGRQGPVHDYVQARAGVGAEAAARSAHSRRGRGGGSRRRGGS